MEKHTFPRLANMAAISACLLAVTAFLADSAQARAQSSSVAPVTQRFVPSGGLVSLASHTPAKVLDGTAIRVGHYNPDQKLRLALAIQPPHMPEEEQFIKELTTKGSPNFHRFLRADQWNARFAPSVQDEQNVVDWAQSQGLTITNRYANRLLVDVEGPASVIEKAFGVTINSYQVGAEVDFANDRDPVIPANLAGTLHGVLGLNSLERVHRLGTGAPTPKGPDYVAGPAFSQAGSTHGDGDPTKAPAARAAATMSTPAPQDSFPLNGGAANPDSIQSSEGYDYNALQRLSHCCNEPGNAAGSPPESSIALVGYGNYNYSDATTFFTNYGMAWNLSAYYINGTGFPPVDGEAPLDVEYSGAMSNSYGAWQNTAQIIEYEMPNGLYATYADAFNAIVSQNYAKVVSTSYGWEENVGFSGSVATGTMHPIFNSMVGTGWTLIAAAGDSGTSDGCNAAVAVDYPASDPDFLAAGGTELQLDANGLFVSEQAWIGETWTGACASNHGGGGGGFSTLFAAPYWQTPTPLSYTQRAMPDISLTANPDVMGEWYYSGGAWQDEGGTSIVAPELAGFFAQENSYLDYIGNKCGAGTTACSPVGLASPFIYEDGINGAPHDPFYDTISGCTGNDITNLYGLGSWCAGAGFDEATGWGSANMLQLAWGINWELIPAYGTPSLAFSGPATSTWYNTNQTISWTLADAGSGTFPAPGVAGFTQGWDSIPADPYSEPHGGDGNSFYSGPQYPFASAGCLAFEPNGCAGGVSQGCHTAQVEGWDNQGRTTFGSYGPICYDTVAPTITVANNPVVPSSGWYKGSVVVTLTPSDPGGSGASGIKTTYYAFNTGTCYPGSLGSCSVYTGPITVSGQQQSYIYYFTVDNAGNYSSEPYEWVSIDTTAPVSTASLGGDLYSGSYYGAVLVTLGATDSGGSGVAHTYYQLDGGATTTYGGSAFTVSAIGSHTVKYWSVDNAGNVESTKTLVFTIAAETKAVLTAPAPGTVLGSVNDTFTWASAPGATGYSLVLGSTGVGSSNLYNSGTVTGTSVAVSNLPANSVKIYARISTSYSGTVYYNDYTYTAPTKSALTSPTPGSTLTGSSATFSWTTAQGATGYTLLLGSTGVGSNNLYKSATLTATSVTVSGLPLTGATIYARLTTVYGAVGKSTDYTYKEATKAALTSPSPGTVLGSVNETFTWTSATGATSYSLVLGSSGVGSSNLYNSGAVTGTSVAVSNLPANGLPIYARLSTTLSGTVYYNDYTYTAPTKAALTSPTPGSTFTSTSVTFTWTAAPGATGYYLLLGSTGAGSNNLYKSVEFTTTSATVTGLPTNGETVYARLTTVYGAAGKSTDYTYKAQ